MHTIQNCVSIHKTRSSTQLAIIPRWNLAPTTNNDGQGRITKEKSSSINNSYELPPASWPASGQILAQKRWWHDCCCSSQRDPYNLIVNEEKRSLSSYCWWCCNSSSKPRSRHSRRYETVHWHPSSTLPPWTFSRFKRGKWILIVCKQFSKESIWFWTLCCSLCLERAFKGIISVMSAEIRTVSSSGCLVASFVWWY